MSTNILFTSVGRRVELLRAFRNAYQTLALEGRIIAVDIDRLAPALRVADASYIVPRLDSREYVPALLQIIKRESVNAVFPLIDPDIPVLSANREALESTGARLAVVSREAAEVAADKWQTTEFFARLGLRTARSWLPEQVDPARTMYPLFIKPRFGSASEHTFKVENAEQLVFFSKYVRRPIVQELLSGPEITSDVICDWEGSVLSIVSRQRIRVRAGEVIVGKTVSETAIAGACERIARALPAIGPITVQCMLHQGLPTFTEINARLGGGAPIGVAAGADWPRRLLARLAGLPKEVSPIAAYQTGLYFSRFDETLIATEAEVEQLARGCL